MKTLEKMNKSELWVIVGTLAAAMAKNPAVLANPWLLGCVTVVSLGYAALRSWVKVEELKTGKAG